MLGKPIGGHRSRQSIYEPLADRSEFARLGRQTGGELGIRPLGWFDPRNMATLVDRFLRSGGRQGRPAVARITPGL